MQNTNLFGIYGHTQISAYFAMCCEHYPRFNITFYIIKLKNDSVRLFISEVMKDQMIRYDEGKFQKSIDQ